MTAAKLSVSSRVRCGGVMRPSRAPAVPPTSPPNSIASACSHHTAPATLKTRTAMVFAALTSKVRGAFSALISRSPSRPHSATMMRPTAPPK